MADVRARAPRSGGGRAGAPKACRGDNVAPRRAAAAPAALRQGFGVVPESTLGTFAGQGWGRVAAATTGPCTRLDPFAQGSTLSQLECDMCTKTLLSPQFETVISPSEYAHCI